MEAVAVVMEHPQVAANLEQVLAGITRAAGEGAQLVVLPEMWPTSFTPGVQDSLLEESQAAVATVAGEGARLGLLVAGTAYGPRAAGGKPTNRLHLFDGGRDLLAYDKVHLFSPTAEPASFAAGRRPCPVVSTAIGRVAGMTCYDLRFPELTRAALRDGVELLVVPAQWPVPRVMHWRRLLAARAIDGLCFIAAANRSGTAVIGRRELELEFPGEACILSPDGEVLDSVGPEGGLASSELDLAEVKRLRRQLPLRKDERPGLYADWLPGPGGGDEGPA